ncbi:ABC transporter permease [Shouchella clausii]|uniref:ABC transporter permease n=1 Tax=Shouchella tritolerans TaxID=2979466 RepID=UPI0007891971|nr:ABC transporter permease subunit [Shouchella tritolerans]GIN10355.1 ABC transporter permease [Shouchella clausii]
MIGLIHNEWLKSWYGRKMWLFSIVMAVFMVGALGVALLVQANTDITIAAEDFSEISVMLFPTFIMLYGVVLIAGAIAGEHANGTVKQLLIRPTSRTKILISKWAGNFLLAGLAFGLLVLVTTAAGLIAFQSDITVLEIIKDTAVTALYQLPTLVFYMALATLIAVLTKSTALTIIITFLPMFFGSIVQFFIVRYEWSKWMVLSHIDFYSNYHEFGTMPEPFANMWASLGFLAAHIALILLVAHVVFQKRDVL